MSAPRGKFEEQTFGRYRLLERLGQGGMAEVFKAKSFGVEGFEKVVVIKRILPALAKHKTFVDMFVHEAKLAVRLSHANIVQVFDLGRVDVPMSDAGPVMPAYFMAMEYVAGMDLATLLTRCQQAQVPVPIGMAVYVAAEVAKGLEHAHRRRDDANQPLGIVHRDVSAQNVLLSWEGEVKVTDFGIAKARDNLQEGGDDSRVRELKGKLSYMSPEQSVGHSIDHRSDLFSLGTVLYEMLTGVNPFRAPSQVETLRRVRAAEFPPIELLRSDVPEALCAIVDRALAASAEDRFADAGRMYEQLLAFLYQSGARFGPSDLCEFLQRFREPVGEGVEEQAQGDLLSKIRERTPVEVPASAPSIRLVDKGSSEAPRRTSLAHRREVTVMALASELGAGRAASELPREVRQRATVIVERYGGRLLEGSVQGELLAIFGLGEPDARDTEYAVRCAQLVLRTTHASLSLGVHCDRVLVGEGGEVIEDEQASALLASAQQLARAASRRVVLSSSAARLVQGLFTLEVLPTGLPASAQMFVVGEVRAPEDTHGRFVGRKDELAKLGTRLGASSKRQLQIITVSGAAGVGKTRLLHEVDRRLRRGAYNVGFYVATCAPRGRDEPLSAVTQMLQVLCGVQEGDAPEKIRAIEPSLRALGLLDEEVEAFLAQLGVPGAKSEGVHPLRSGFVKTLMSLSDDRVNVFAWDDAHCLDDASAQLLVSAARRLHATRTAFLLAGRDAFVNPLRSLGAPEAIELGPLGDDDAIKLVGHRLGVAELPKPLVDFCLLRAGGHPLFVEELLKDMVDAGAVVVEGGVITRLRLDGEMTTPRPLRSLIAGRVARLARSEQAAVEQAAVLGEPIEREVMVSLLGGASAADATLSALESRELLRRSGASSFVFASPLLRDVVLDSVPREARRGLHERVARALEGALGVRVDEQASHVAEHYLAAGDRARAATFYVRSARRRLSTRQYEAAGADARRALELIDPSTHSPAEIVEALRALSSAVDRTRVAPHAPELFAGLLAGLDAQRADDERLGARVEVARVLGAISRFTEALAVLAEARAGGAASLGVSQRVSLIEAQLHARRGDFNTSLRILEEARVEGLDRSLEQRALLLLAQAYGALGERDKALGLVEEAALSPEGDLAAEAERHKLRGLIHYFAREFAASVKASERAVQIAREGQLAYEIAISLHNAGDALLHLGDYSRAYVLLSQSLEACEACGAERLVSQNRMFLGYLDAVRGLPGGEVQLRSGIAHAEEQGYSWDIVNGRYLLGLLLEQIGMVGMAAAEFEACRVTAGRISNRLIEQLCVEAVERCRARG